MDIESTCALVAIEIADLREAVEARRAKSVEGSPIANANLAINTQLEDLVRLHTNLTERCIAAHAGRADARYEVVEAALDADGNLASAMAGLHVVRNPPTTDDHPAADDLARFSRAAENYGRDPVDFQPCVSCDAKTETIQAPCGDHYCQSCTRALHQAALENETLFPVRCCR